MGASLYLKVISEQQLREGQLSSPDLDCGLPLIGVSAAARVRRPLQLNKSVFAALVVTYDRTQWLGDLLLQSRV